jgi:hypothetical protein
MVNLNINFLKGKKIMLPKEKLYKSILHQLEVIPDNQLYEIDAYIKNLIAEIRDKEKNRQKILALAGSWSDMSDEDFRDFLQSIKDLRVEMFNREIQL